MIAGIVLAGGESRRMGQQKAGLRAEGETFLSRAVNTLTEGGCEEVVVVTSGSGAEGASEPLNSARIAEGAGVGSEQIDSLRAGLRALPRNADAAIVIPVDHPYVKSETVSALIDAFRRRGAPIVRPVHNGRHGHPVLFAKPVFAELLESDLPQGARSVVRAHQDALEDVSVDDEGVLIDVDTPEDHARHLKRLK